MRISLILATIGRAEDFGRFVIALIRQTCRDFELIVVDQNLDDRLLPYIEGALQAGLDVSHFRLKKPSLAGARNLGIEHARGDFIGFPDDDCWYENDTIATVLAAIEGNAGWQGVIARWVEQSQTDRSDPGTGPLIQSDWRRFRGGNASSITLFLNRELFVQLGGFDERMGVGQWYGAGEETDFVLRALSAGAVIGRWPAARVHHLYWARVTERPGLTWRAVQCRARGTGALYIKHRLSMSTIIRGLLAPPLVALRSGLGVKGLGFAFALSIGRLQGALQWLLSK